MSAGKVICPQCGAENVDSTLITLCSQCLGSLKGARPAAPPAEGAPAEPAPPAPDRAPAPAPPPEAAPAPPPERLVCPRCRAANPPDYRYCAVCGASLPVTEAVPQAPSETAPLSCPRCHHENEPGRIFCRGCGFDLRLRLEEVEGKPWSPPDHAQTTPGRVQVHFARERPATSGTTKAGACCGCLVLGFIFFIAMVIINAAR